MSWDNHRSLQPQPSGLKDGVLHIVQAALNSWPQEILLPWPPKVLNLTLSPGLECSGVISTHCNFCPRVQMILLPQPP
ncbi:hypothetical protein AAY473_012211, partial [Plecturocebus cupreus]